MYDNVHFLMKFHTCSKTSEHTHKKYIYMFIYIYIYTYTCIYVNIYNFNLGGLNFEKKITEVFFQLWLYKKNVPMGIDWSIFRIKITNFKLL